MNDTLRRYCQDIDNLILHPEQAKTFVTPQPTVGDQMILLNKSTGTNQRVPIEVPVVIQITHGQYRIQAQAWVYSATVVGCRDFSQKESAQAKGKLSTGEEGEIVGTWCDGIFMLGTDKFQDHREWVLQRLSLQDDQTACGMSAEILRQIKVKNEVINLNLTDFDEPPLLTTGCHITQLLRWARPASSHIPFLGSLVSANAKRTFMGQWNALDAELSRLRKVGQVSGLTPKLVQQAEGLVIRIAAFGQTWAREQEWGLLSLWALRLNVHICAAPEGSPVDPVLTPIKRWLNEFVFPD